MAPIFGKTPGRYVVDTNLLVSATLVSGTIPDIGLRVIELAGGRLVFSSETFDELSSVLMRPKFDRYVSRRRRQEAISLFARNALFVVPEIGFTHCRDSRDNKFLDVSVAGQVECLITGDSDLLVLEEIAGIPILGMADFLQSAKSPR